MVFGRYNASKLYSFERRNPALCLKVQDPGYKNQCQTVYLPDNLFDLFGFAEILGDTAYYHRLYFDVADVEG